MIYSTRFIGKVELVFIAVDYVYINVWNIPKQNLYEIIEELQTI